MSASIRPLRGLVAVALVALVTPPEPVMAQTDRGAQWELRADVIAARQSAAQIAVGTSWILGTYVRLATLVGAGIGPRAGGDAVQGSGRADVVIRFTLDPLREVRWGLYGGSGLGVMYDPCHEWRGVLTLALGVEGPPMHGVMPAFELGVGGGVRAGVIIRRARRSMR